MKKKNLLKDKYEKEVVKGMMSEFGTKNRLSVPKINKVVVNMGIKDLHKDKQLKEQLQLDLATITGQKPKVQPAKKSIAGFGIRQGMPVGLTVTLRGERMYSFLAKVITAVLPRLRDFRGVPRKSFDKAGNYTIGFSEHTVFPELDIAKVGKPHGLEMTIVINSGDPKKSFKMLELLGMPFEKEE